MVGSALPRKNRILALNVLMSLGNVSPYRLILAGAPLTKAEADIVNQYQLQNRVVSVVRPSHALLNHLYCRAHALLFPSFSEGFGWPLIEAQACACPVIASTTTSIPEVAGAGALFADPSDPSAFAEHVLALEDPVLRRLMIEQGLTNMQKYDPALVSRQLAAFALGSS
jgi:glycosyltransferase involved in cell wall biosynthesis